MAGRPRRNIQHLNYRRIHLHGLDEDSSESEGSEEDEDRVVLECDEEQDLDESESPKSDSEDDTGSEDEVNPSYIGRDGTEWAGEALAGSFLPWRSGIKDFGDGPVGSAKQTPTIFEMFRLFMTDDVLCDICKWTNLYAKYCVDTWNQENLAKQKNWTNVTVVELRAFIGLALLAGIEKSRKKPWNELWDLREAIRCRPFPATMSRTRFYNLMNMIRFDDVVERRIRKQESEKNPSIVYNTLDPIKDIFNCVVSKFEDLFEPGSKLCIDEQIVKFRGQCPFRVYMPAKPGKYGIKIWALVDNSSGYLLNLQVYQGQIGDTHEVGQSKRVVMELTRKYFGTERGIVADNFFTSFELVKELLVNKLTYCGTLRKSRREVPAITKDLTNAVEGSTMFLYHPQTSITLLRYMTKKKKYVLLLSSAHTQHATPTPRSDKEVLSIPSKRKEKPCIVEYYNTMKGGVDTADQMLSTYSSQFPSKRWPMKLFLHLVDSCALNAFVLYLRNNPEWMHTTKSRRRIFIRQLAYDLITPQIQYRSSHTANLHSHIRAAMETMGVEPIPTTSRQSHGPNDPRKSVRCPFDKIEKGKRQKSSRTQCDKCKTFICLDHQTVLCPKCKSQ